MYVCQTDYNYDANAKLFMYIDKSRREKMVKCKKNRGGDENDV